MDLPDDVKKCKYCDVVFARMRETDQKWKLRTTCSTQCMQRHGWLRRKALKAAAQLESQP